MATSVRNSRGFSLIELTFALGLTSLVIYGSAQVYQMIAQMRINADAVLQQAILNQDISLALSSPALCDANFVGKSARVGLKQTLTLHRRVDGAGNVQSPIQGAAYAPLNMPAINLEYIGRSGPNFLARVTVETETKDGTFKFRPLVYNFRLFADSSAATAQIVGCKAPKVDQPLASLGRCPSSKMVSGLNADGTMACADMPPGPPGPPGPSGGGGSTCFGANPTGATGEVCTSAGWAVPP